MSSNSEPVFKEDKQHIEKIENGKVNPTIHSQYLIALALEVKLEDLVRLPSD